MTLRAYRAGLAFITAVLTLAGCAYTGGVENPVARKLSWFSYAAGDDLKRRCGPGAVDQFRLVYNADWHQQVRTYDLRRSVLTEGGGMLFVHVFGGGADMARFSFDDVTMPWRGNSSQTRLEEPAYQALVRAIEESGFQQPAPAGVRLDSWDYYWLVSACIGGRFHFNAWKYPSDRAVAIRFDQALFANDTTGVPVRAPRHVDSAEARYIAERDQVYTFQLMIGRDGLANRFSPL
jgi:hypothetical protein